MVGPRTSIGATTGHTQCAIGSSDRQVDMAGDRPAGMAIDGGSMHNHQDSTARPEAAGSEHTQAPAGRPDQLHGAAAGPSDTPVADGETAVARVFRVLKVFTSHQPPLTLSQLAVQARLPLSTAYRFARDLNAQGALIKDRRGRYSVGPTLIAIAMHADQQTDVPDAR